MQVEFQMFHNHDGKEGNVEIQNWNLKETVMEALKAQWKRENEKQ